ncbi:MAG: hypothetical protein ABIQ10_13595 [Gemmatimonadaceae bacterium]
MTDPRHLSEEARHGAADGTLDAEGIRAAKAHIAACESCAADVARLNAVVMITRADSAPPMSQADLWPSIQLRIDASKVVPLDQRAGATVRARARRPWLAIGSTTVAAALVIAAFAEMKTWVDHAPTSQLRQSDVAFASAADSARSYEDEARRLLNEFEMERAMMGPSTSKSLESDLAIIDASIAEQKAALARDPSSVALQRLLASSYREKVELLKRANNAS